ncbi:hypothetical protein C8J30_102330 [Rhodobacter viridis]|uniref:Uncharacterized protein n=1 Tax=Rhodobacter viridis TaxID=1054202 RepID=A0A318U537_9RHOB|nr:hypothetical protein [Rhodobacter viridis]PYF12015.1 hypothetical protein C8J30_102330 [Rhodobacter viridis]
MTFSRSELFVLAWELARQDLWSRRLPASRLRGLFPAALSRAWSIMRAHAANRARRLAAAATARPVEEIRTEIVTLECKDCLRGADWQRLDALRAELNAAFAMAA